MQPFFPQFQAKLVRFPKFRAPRNTAFVAPELPILYNGCIIRIIEEDELDAKTPTCRSLWISHR